jgi:hypothetical protein
VTEHRGGRGDARRLRAREEVDVEVRGDRRHRATVREHEVVRRRIGERHQRRPGDRAAGADVLLRNGIRTVISSRRRSRSR